MAFKRSAVRSRLSPPSQGKEFFLAAEKRRGFLCRNRCDIQSKLLQVNVEVDVQLVVPVDLHSLNQAVDDHLLGLHAGAVVHVGPGDDVVILCVVVLDVFAKKDDNRICLI